MNEITASRLGKIEELLRKNYELLNKFEDAKLVETHPRKLASMNKK